MLICLCPGGAHPKETYCKEAFESLKSTYKNEVVNFTTKPYINQLKEDIRKARN